MPCIRVFHIDMMIESSKMHSHYHNHLKRNPHANISSEERFSRLCMFLEAQFGPQITPITHPKLSSKTSELLTDSDAIKSEPNDKTGVDEIKGTKADLEAEELERLHSIGIPVPGVEIRVDHHVAKVWLENLEVECGYGILRDRVKAVVERAIETIAPLWTQRNG